MGDTVFRTEFMLIPALSIFSTCSRFILSLTGDTLSARRIITGNPTGVAVFYPPCSPLTTVASMANSVFWESRYQENTSEQNLPSQLAHSGDRAVHHRKTQGAARFQLSLRSITKFPLLNLHQHTRANAFQRVCSSE